MGELKRQAHSAIIDQFDLVDERGNCKSGSESSLTNFQFLLSLVCSIIADVVANGYGN